MDHSRSVLITGCSSGIGYRAAHILKDRGYWVFASARKQQDVDRLISEGLEGLRLDLNDSSSIQAAMDEVLARTDGTLYALFNNGAYGQPGAVEDLTRDVMRAQLETNLLGWLELINRVVPIMRTQGYGRIIQNSSVLGLVALPFRGAYIASKYALEGLSDTLRQELKPSGIRVCLIEPGPIESRFRANSLIAFEKNINIKDSIFTDNYLHAIERLRQKGPAVPFTLPSQAVVRKLIHALESRRPKPRYYVTFPTYLLVSLKRITGTRLLDRILLAMTRGERP